jgi:hypothetical protein
MTATNGSPERIIVSGILNMLRFDGKCNLSAKKNTFFVLSRLHFPNNGLS